MHIQARAKPQKSPPDLAAFLRELAADSGTNRDAINIEGVSGASIEQGGEFVFAVTHGRAGDAHDRLTTPDPQTGEHYDVEWTTDLYSEPIPPEQGSGGANLIADDPNQPGVLLGIVQRAKGAQIASGRDIDSVLIGAVTGESGHYFVQVTFVGSVWNTERPGQDD